MTIKFKLLQLAEGAESLIGFAKSKAEALIDIFAGELGFHRTWSMGDFTVRMQANRYTNTKDWLVRLWFSGRAALSNWMYGGLFSGQSTYNFELAASTADTPWYDRVATVGLPALGSVLKFSIVRDSEPSFESFDDSFTGESLLLQLRDHVLNGSKASTRFWIRFLLSRIVIRYAGATIVTAHTDVLVSEPSNGNFYILLGQWTARDNTDTIPDADPTTPRQFRYDGIVVSWRDIEAQIPNIKIESSTLVLPPPFGSVTVHQTVLSFDEQAVMPNGGPKVIGRLYSSLTPPTVAASGLHVFRKETGTFDDYDANDRCTIVYRPDADVTANLESQYVGNAQGMLFVTWFHTNVVGNPWTQTQTQTFDLYRLTTGGDFIVEALVPPAARASVSTSHSVTGLNGGSYPNNYTMTDTISAFSSDHVFFDGREYIVCGDWNQTSGFYTATKTDQTNLSQTIVGPITTFRSALPISNMGTFVDAWIPDHNVMLVFDNVIGLTNLVHRSTFGTRPYVESASGGVLVNGLLYLAPNDPYPAGIRGLSWGSGSFSTSGNDEEGASSEEGFGVHVFQTTISGPASDALDTRRILQLGSYQLFQTGAYWHRRSGVPGVFIYRAIGSTFTQLCNDYRAAYFATPEPNWAVLEPLLTQIMNSIAIRMNNFASPTLIPWIANSNRLAIIER